MFLNSLKQNRKKGFTIIELLVVISIIGLLSTISVVVLNGARIKSRDTKRVSDINNIKTALELYFNDKGYYPTSNTPTTLGVSPNLVLCDAGFVASQASCSAGKIYMNNVPTNVSPGGTPYFYTSLTATPETYSITFTIEKNVESLLSGEITATNFGISNTPVMPFVCGNTVVYYGEVYTTISINGQCWFAENLRTTKYPNGTDITKGPAANLAAGWSDVATAYYSCPSNSGNTVEDCGAASGSTKLGMLYQWKTAMNGSTTSGAQGICPTGWHIPTNNEQYLLENYLKTGASCNVNTSGWDCDGSATKLKTTTPTWDGTNTYGFTALPTGYRYINGGFSYSGTYMLIWSSTEFDASTAWRRLLSSASSTINRSTASKANAVSVRCILD